MKYFLILCFTLIVSCSPSIKTERISLEKSDQYSSTITDEWVSTDTELAIREILNQIDNHKGFQTYLLKLGKKPKLFVGEIQNKTSEAYFPIDDMNDELLYNFSSSGDYVLIDSAKRERILEEITYQNDGMVKPEDIKKIGRQSGADLIIFGNINMKPNTLNGRTTKDYSVNIRMTDIESGEEVLRTRFKTSKYSKRSGSGW